MNIPKIYEFYYGDNTPPVPLNPLNTGLLSAYYFNQNSLANKGKQDAIGVDLTYSADFEGYKANFNGTSSRAYIDMSSDFTITGDFSLNVDVTFNALGTRMQILSVSNAIGTDTSIAFLLEKDSNNKIYFYGVVGSTFNTIESTSTYTTGVKYIIVLKKVGTSYSLYVNDTLQGSVTIASSLNASPYKVGIGALGEFTGGQFLNGSISAVRTWGRELTTLELTELYNGGNGFKFNVPQAGMSTDDVVTQPIDGNATGYATFQSNSQRTVVNDYGIFQVYLHSTDNPSVYQNQTWYLQQSTDGGRTFTTVYTNTTFDYVPCLETDSVGNLYLAYTVNGTTARLLKFLSTDYTTPSVSTNLPITVTSKFCMVLDDVNDKIYYFNARGYLTILNKACTITTAATEIVTTGVVATLMYPSATLDNIGNVYFAWTNQNNTGGVFYYNIRWAVSRDFGITWQKADGTPLTLPIVSDTGAEEVSVVGDLGVQNWLSAWTFVNDRIHAIYWRDSTAQKYVNIHPTTAVITHSQDIYTGSNPQIDGFFIRDKTGTISNKTNLFFVTAKTNRTELTIYKSTNNGATWTNPSSRYAVQLLLYYSICGYREQVSGYGYGILTLLTTRAITYTENECAYVYSTKLKLT